MYNPHRGNSRTNKVNQRNTDTKNESKSQIRILNIFGPKTADTVNTFNTFNTVNTVNTQVQPTLKMDNLLKANSSNTYQNDSKFDKGLQFADNSKNNQSKKKIDSSNILNNHNSYLTENSPTPCQFNKEISSQQLQQLSKTNTISTINKNLEKNQMASIFTIKNELRATTSPAITNGRNYGNQNQKEIEVIKLKNNYQGQSYMPVNCKTKLSIQEVNITKDCSNNPIKIYDNQNHAANSFNAASKGADDRKSNFQNCVNTLPSKLITTPDVHNTRSERNRPKIKMISEGNKFS